MRRAVADDDHEALVTADAAFHRIVREASGNEVIARLLRDLEGTVDSARHALMSLPSRVQRVIPDHEGILDAIRAGDAEIASARTLAHIRRSKEELIASGAFDWERSDDTEAASVTLSTAAIGGPPVDYVNLGRTGVKISRLVLGGGNFGGIGSSPAFFGQGETEEQAFRLMDAAVDMGINVIDTADAYGGGRSEEMIGRWLKTKGSHVRDQLLMSSKVFNPVGDGPNDLGLSRRHIMRQVQASIRRLGVDHLDLYLIHEPDPDHSPRRDPPRTR